MAVVHLLSPRYFENWSYLSPEIGIGGSETMHVEMARRLAARGHLVTSYAPIPEDTLGCYEGVYWKHLDTVDYTQPGTWIIIRGLGVLEQFGLAASQYYSGHISQRLWCVFQDVDEFPHVWSEVQPHLHKLDRLITLCQAHYDYHQHAHPEIRDRLCLSRNGLRGEVVDQVLTEGLVRNPHRLTFASSPDRGLLGLLTAFRLVRFLVPDAELHIFYGLDNIDKLQKKSSGARWTMERIQRAAAQPGVVWRGRIGQTELYREWSKTGIWCNPTNFAETGCITSMEAQALGAVPVLNPQWAAGENQLAGIAIEGDGELDQLNLRRYAMATVYLMQHPEIQDEVRPAMMEAARKKFDWSGVADQYEEWMAEESVPGKNTR